MIKIKLAGFSDETGNPLSVQLDTLSRNDVPYMEMRCIDGVNVADFEILKAKEYKKQILDAGIKVWSIGSPLGKVDINVNFNEYLDKVKKVCETANLFEAKNIRIFSFFNAYNERNKVIEYLSKMVEVGASYGVKLCHENEKEIYGDNLERVKDLIKNVKGLCLVYDPANFVQVGEDTSVTLNELYDFSEYFHIKDVIKSTDELVPAGHGDGNIVKLVNKIDRNVTLTLEPHLFVFDSFAKIDNTSMKHKFKFKDSNEAFDFATNELKKVLINAGYVKTDDGFIKGE